MSTAYHAKYFAYELTKRCASDSMEKLAASLADAQVDLNPHQVEAALFAFRSPLSKGAILADEVGLGKTIEAGILLSQRWAERKRKILVIVPASLRKQWHQELSDKFFLPSVILETKTFNEQIRQGNLNPFDRSEIVICSYQFARAKEPYIRQVAWNLAVIDEAHRLRNVYKPSNKIGNAIKAALAPHDKLLLTATPLQNSLLELFGLVSIVDEHIFGDIKSFRSQFSRLDTESDFQSLRERLKPICQRTLRRQVLEYIPFTNRIALVEEFIPSDAEQKLYNVVSDYLQRQRLYALPASQRQLMTLILRRLLASSTFAIAGTLEGLANKLEKATKAYAPVVEAPEEVAQTFESFEEMEDEWEADEEEKEQDKKAEERRFTPEEIEQMTAEIQSLRLFTELANSIVKNSKGERLQTALKRGLAEAKKKGGAEKAIIFTESTRTQEYVRSILESIPQYKGKVVLFNGSNNDPKSKEIYQNWLKKHEGTDRITGSKTADMRAALVDYFRDEAIIMVATEAAAEGINLQFCSLVINYDLPWNPQRIEQRIGRCHRYGQKHDVVVVNFLNKKNAADQRVYQLLDEKFKLFSGVFGASDEVLGSIESGIDFEKRIADIYQKCRTEEQIQFNFDQLQQELEQQIDERIKQTRQKLLENFDEEVHEKLRVNLRESSEVLNKYDNWLWQLTRFYLQPYAKFEDGQNGFMLINNPFPDAQIHPGPYRSGKNIEDANLYRMGHPLAQKIIEQCKASTPDSQALVFDYRHSGKKISIIEPLVGKSGFVRVVCQSVTALETEDFVLLSGICDDGTPVDAEQCRRFFSLDASQGSAACSYVPETLESQLDEGLQRQQKEVLAKFTARNAKFFETELDKLERWADDMVMSVEKELADTKGQIKAANRQAQMATTLQEQHSWQERIRELEKQMRRQRQRIFDVEDEITARRDGLIAGLEKRLSQRTTVEPLFTVRFVVA
ncbi:MAG TPA: SNF2-related protein [Terriglobales bacterium]|jgi:ERCC4-related helicase|nr:SNF2-related protein [Terriglobales bacterium]